MALTYSSYVSEIATITAISSTTLETGDNNFQGIMPALIDYVEGRLYRELDLPVTSVTDTSVSMSSGVRSVLLSTSQGELLVLQSVNLFTPPGATSSNATRVPLVPASQAVINTIYPSAASAQTGQPEFFARVSNVELILGPTPDQAYGTEVIASVRPNPLSASNSSTWLTQNYPELMVAGGMIFAAGYMRDFGAQSDNPQMAASWESQFNNLLNSAKSDSMRMQYEGSAWTSANPAPAASPPRS